MRRVSFESFKHLHTLDLNFHKASSKNTVFAINRAIRSIESGLRFTFGFFSPIAFEFILLCGMLQFYCGPAYLANMIVTLGLYTKYSLTFSKKRIVYIRDQKNKEKKQEFYLNESIMNYETVKSFNNINLETSRYEKLLFDMKGLAEVV